MGERRGRGDEKCQRRDGDQISKTGELGKARQVGTDQVLERDFIKNDQFGNDRAREETIIRISISRGERRGDCQSFRTSRGVILSFLFALSLRKVNLQGTRVMVRWDQL